MNDTENARKMTDELEDINEQVNRELGQARVSLLARSCSVVQSNSAKTGPRHTNEQTAPFNAAFHPPKVSPIKLKGVTLPMFSGDDKTEYESWKAAFMSVVDEAPITVKEKMLRLLGSLSGKAWRMVKDLGYSENAYARAKERLGNKFGGERRIQLKNLTTLRGWRKLRPANLDDMEEFLAVLDRVQVSLLDSPEEELNGQSLSLTAKEKLCEEDVQAYKFWCLERQEKDNFKSLVRWLEIRVKIMDEAKEEIGGYGKGKSYRPEEQRRKGFNTTKKSRKCIVDSCVEDLPPWTSKIFKGLPVQRRKELIMQTGRCFRCLAAGH